MLAHDRNGESGLAVLIDRSQHLILLPGSGFRGALLFGRARPGDELAARQAEAGEFANHGVAADADMDGDLAAREAGIKMAFQEFDAFGGPGRSNGKHVRFQIALNRRFQMFPSGRPAVIADCKQPVLDGEPNAFLDQGLRDAGNAGTVGALSHQFFEIGDGRERQGDWNAVGFGFFRSHEER
jgi:hypothetical protein